MLLREIKHLEITLELFLAFQYGVTVGGQVTQFQPTVLQTISNPDGSVSIIQVDPTNSIITLPDGTTAQVQGVATVSSRLKYKYAIYFPKNVTSIV